MRKGERMVTLDKSWHLARGENDGKVTEFELQLWRVFYSFIRWQEECEKSINGSRLTGNDIAVLHIIRMQDKPKSPFDVGRLLNRDDTFNIKYSIQKLLKLNLIEKVKINQDVKTLYYQVTEQGKENTDLYTQIRKSILIELFQQTSEIDLIVTAKTLSKIKSIYDEADRAVASSTNLRDHIGDQSHEKTSRPTKLK